MLVLARRPSEAIRIGDDIRIVVTNISGKQVKLGIAAKPGVKIVREELLTAEQVPHKTGNRLSNYR